MIRGHVVHGRVVLFYMHIALLSCYDQSSAILDDSSALFCCQLDQRLPIRQISYSCRPHRTDIYSEACSSYSMYDSAHSLQSCRPSRFLARRHALRKVNHMIPNPSRSDSKLSPAQP